MEIEQFVMAYGAEQDRLRAILPDGFTSLRPVLRINGEVRDGKTGYLEFNTAVEKDGRKGWLNIGCRENVPFEKEGKTTTFRTDLLEISFTGVGLEGSCPAEKDNAGCWFCSGENASEEALQEESLREPEVITASKEFCDCEFSWHGVTDGAHGVSIGKTLPAIPEEEAHQYPKEAFTVEHAAKIPCRQVLGSYLVRFER